QIDQISRETTPNGDEVIDLNGAVLAPGFIESHSHSDFEVFEDPFLAPKVRQGITTEMIGQDGFGAAPVSPSDANEWATRMQTFSGSADEPQMFERVSQYLDAIDNLKPALNLGMLAGHGTIRYHVMGMDDRTATFAELETMQDLLADSLNEGCYVLSTGLIYHPQVHSNTKELLQLCDILAETNRPFVAQIRSEGHWLFEAMYEFISTGYETGVPLHLSHFKLSGRKQH